jgi:hypothetical protein
MVNYSSSGHRYMYNGCDETEPEHTAGRRTTGKRTRRFESIARPALGDYKQQQQQQQQQLVLKQAARETSNLDPFQITMLLLGSSTESGSSVLPSFPPSAFAFLSLLPPWYHLLKYKRRLTMPSSSTLSTSTLASTSSPLLSSFGITMSLTFSSFSPPVEVLLREGVGMTGVGREAARAAAMETAILKGKEGRSRRLGRVDVVGRS